MGRKIKIGRNITELLKEGRAIYVSTSSVDGIPNTSLKGLVKVEPKGSLYFMDLFNGKTRHNLEKNNKVSITVSDIDEFKGFQLKGTARLIKKGKIFKELSARWANLSANMVTERIIKNVQRGYSHGRHELHLPKPKSLVKVEVNKIYDLCPKWIRDLKGRG